MQQSPGELAENLPSSCGCEPEPEINQNLSSLPHAVSPDGASYPPSAGKLAHISYSRKVYSQYVCGSG